MFYRSVDFAKKRPATALVVVGAAIFMAMAAFDSALYAAWKMDVSSRLPSVVSWFIAARMRNHVHAYHAVVWTVIWIGWGLMALGVVVGFVKWRLWIKE